MTGARLERITRDALLASRFLQQARTFLNDGNAESVSDESRQVLLHNAAIAACDSVLAINGFTVEGSDGGHRLRLDKAEELLSDDLADLFERLDDVRLTRAEASYRAGFVPASDLDAALIAVTELVQLAEDHVTPQFDE